MTDTPGYGFVQGYGDDAVGCPFLGDAAYVHDVKAENKKLKGLLTRCLPMLDSLDGELSIDFQDWEDRTGERSKARVAERLECSKLMDEVRGAL